MDNAWRLERDCLMSKERKAALWTTLGDLRMNYAMQSSTYTYPLYTQRQQKGGVCGIDNAISQTSLGTTVQNHTHIYDRMLERFVGQGRSSCEDRNKLDLGDCLMSKERKAALWTTLGDLRMH